MTEFQRVYTFTLHTDANQGIYIWINKRQDFE